MWSGAAQNHPLMAEVKTVEEAEGKMAKSWASRGGGKRFIRGGKNVIRDD